MDLRRILLLRTDRVGDLVLTLPMVDALRASNPSAEVDLLVRGYTRELVDGYPGVSGVHVSDPAGRPSGIMDLARTLKKRGYDAAVHVYPRMGQAVATLLAGIPHRVGTAYRAYSVLFNHRVPDHRRLGERHEAVYNVRLLRAIGVTVPDHVQPRLFPGDREGAVALRVRKDLGIDDGDRFAVLHPGSGGSAKDWPLRRFSELANVLAQRGLRVAVTGSADEAGMVDRVVAGSGAGVSSVAGRFSLMELAAFLRLASVVVSNSTGPLHIAAAVGTPVVGLFPPVRALSADRWGPLSPSAVTLSPDPAQCPRCRGGECRGEECMDLIAVAEVAEHAVRLSSAVKPRL